MENATITGEEKHRRSMATNKNLQKAIAERDRYLGANPHLAAYQAEIDRILDKSGNHEGRMAVLGTLIQGKMLEMQNELKRLTDLVHNVQSVR